MIIIRIVICTLVLICSVQLAFLSHALPGGKLPDPYLTLIVNDTVPVKDRLGDFLTAKRQNPFDLKDPEAVKQSIEYDPESSGYFISEKIGDDYFRTPSYMSFEEYLKWKSEEQERTYFQRLSGLASAGSQVGADIDPIRKYDIDRSLIDRLFGGSTVNIDPKGSIDLTFGFDYQNVQNPVLLERQQRNGGFDFDMAIRMDVDGQIGEKLKLNANYNTQATFDFDRQLKLQYDSELFSEDEILKKVEAGNVSLPLKNSLIQGSQSLFGLKTDMQFGRLRLTTIVSQQNSEQKNLKIEKGAQLQEFLIRADQYDENRHFFLSHYNRSVFDESLRNMPQISSLFKVTKIEVWVTNERRETENTRNIVALADLGEYDRITNINPRFQTPPEPRNPEIRGRELPDNSSNDLYRALLDNPMSRDIENSVSTLRSSDFQLEASRDFEKVRARQLRSSEYTLEPDLGFISINTLLQPDQVLAVAYEYIYNGEKFQVGELSTDFPSETEDESVLFVKLLKSTTQRVDVPAWDLMMKNVYSIGAFQVTREDFYLDIFYEDPGHGEKRFLPEPELKSMPLLRLFNLDNLNEVGDPQPDGAFDFVPGITINLSTGRIMFPILEPFGSSLAAKFSDPQVASPYIFQQLYDSTITRAREYPDLNRFTIKARFKSSVSNEYSLGAFNVPEGSVKVYAGGQLLEEGRDYDVDYNLGKVRIINEAYANSSIPIRVSFEDNALFSFNRKTMLGLRADYMVNKNLTVGATYLHLFERPYTEKVNIGDDPINNRIIGLDINYSKEAPWLTRLVDKIPLINTIAPSNIAFTAEGAVLKPGHSKAINQGEDKGGSLYIDDFEGSSIGIDLRTPTTQWVFASVPQNDNANNNPHFPEGELANNRLSGVNRALINWYRIETAIRSPADRDDPYARRIDQNEVFPNRSRQFGINNNIQTFDVTFYPWQRGPYNFDVPGGTAYSAGLDNEGRLLDPESRWGGIMRNLRNTDFEAANIEYIEFWMMNPYEIRGDGTRLSDDGLMYINLGNISEDILKDSRLSYENGLPTPGSAAPVDTTAWGLVPIVQDITGSFATNEADRLAQDVGLDGMNDEQEREFFADYIQAIQSLNLEAREAIQADPSNDNFQHYRNYPDEASVFTRYSKYNNVEGNSMVSSGNQLESSTNYPDREDLNNDNTLNESESYFQYEIPISYDGLGGMALNQFITDTLKSPASGSLWYRFQIPVEQFQTTVGSIQDFRSIRFIRIYLRDFNDQITLRFAKLDLVRNTWRKYTRSLQGPGISEPDNTGSNFQFDISSVNIEENSEKFPFNYVLPRGIKRERSIGTYANLLQNEQSLALNMCNLPDGDAVAIYKNVNEDFRNYEQLKMFVHAGAKDDAIIDPGQLAIFIRMGSDFTRNYYEYEIPLVISDPRASADAFRDPDEIWKEENAFDFPLELFRDAKILRNNEGASLSIPYEISDPNNQRNKARVIGNPNLGLVNGIMVGVRNVRDDGLDQCAEVWINELRLNGLNERGGAAAVARLDLQLADFGRLSLSGNYSSIGWGALDQKLALRQLEEVVQYDLAANVELGKFLPEEWGISIPFYAQYSTTISNPQYDPYDKDIELKEKLSEAPDKVARDSIRDQASDFTSIKSINFTNVRKERTNTQTTPKPWDVSNFSFTYAQSETRRHDPVIENDQTNQYRGSVDYGYNTRPVYIQPFKGIEKDKLIKFLTEFNFNPIPNSFSFNTGLDRQFTEKSYRFSEPDFKTWYTKRFTWDRNYNLNWDLTKSLKFRYNASNLSVIDELDEVDIETGERPAEQEKKDFLINNLKNFGRTKDYNHSINISYKLPLQFFPLLDFAQIQAQVTSNYSWNAAALNVDSLGNIIQNSQQRQVSADVNLERLYHRWPYLRQIDQGNKPVPPSQGNQGNQRNPQQDNSRQSSQAREPGFIERLLIRPLLSIRRFRVQYSEIVGSTVPGFMPRPRFVGLNREWNAPGTKYILGFQPDNQWFVDAANSSNNWITENIFLNQEVLLNNTTKWNASLSLEPFQNFRVEVNWDYNFIQNHSEFFKKQTTGSPFERLAPRDVGSFNISYFTLNTLFEKDIEQLFEEFENNRPIISQRLGTGVHANDGPAYTEGFGKYQRNVLIPAFISTYADIDPRTIELNIIEESEEKGMHKANLMPRPNWQINYNGLSQIPFFQEIFSNVAISHGYRSTLSVNSYNTDYDYVPDDPANNINEVTGDFFSRFEIPAIVISEQFSPLLGINVQTKNNISLRLDMVKSRNLSLSFTDYQMNEAKRTEYVFGFGYQIQNVNIPFLQGKNQRSRSRSRRDTQDQAEPDPNVPGNQQASQGNDLEINFNFSFSDNVSLIHKFDTELDPQASRGNKQIRFSPSIDYELNKNLTLRFFFDYNKTTPYTSRSYPITNINSGVTVKFSLD